jgi:hypothetical protein
MMLSLACVIVDHGEYECCGLSKGWNGGDGWISLGDVDSYAQIC